jgi:hypothetical protein
MKTIYMSLFIISSSNCINILGTALCRIQFDFSNVNSRAMRNCENTFIQGMVVL